MVFTLQNDKSTYRGSVMKNIKHEEEKLNKYIADREYIANTYVMRCFFISMVVYTVCFMLNLLDIFIVDKKIMLMGYLPSILIYLVVFGISKKVSLSSSKIKYFILFSIVSVFTLIGISITYHVVIIAVLPILYAILYSSKKVMWYVYGLTVISTIIIVYAGYYWGLCDANMALLTTTKLANYLSDGAFTLNAVNNNTAVTLMLFFVVPRCLTYIAFMAICGNIYAIIKAGVEKAEAAIQMEVFQKELKSKVDEQTVELREQQRKLKEAYWQTVIALSEAVDAKDRYTSGHSRRVAEYSRIIAAKMGKSEIEQEMVYRAGLLHDVGKIRIPVGIINKPERLTDEEYDLIKIHPVTGYHILDEISEHTDMALAAKYHHERYDGKGYPNGLKGEVIPEIARILAVADSYDAMTSNRSYRKGLPQEVVRKEIEKGRGTQFDPEIADILLQLIDLDKEYKLRQIDMVSYKILLVSEDLKTEQQIKAIVQEENIYEVISVRNKDDAFAKLEEQPIELLLLDIQVEQACIQQMVKSIKENYSVPIVILSDESSMKNTTGITEYECDDYITRPFRPLVIKEMIYNMTKKSQIHVSEDLYAL